MTRNNMGRTLSEKSIRPSVPSAKSSRILTFVLLGISIYLAMHFCMYIDYAVRMAAFPYEVDSGEGLSLHRAIALSQGKNIYTPIDRPPYTVTNYPPLYDLVFSGFVKIWGPQLLLGRLVSIISAITVGFLVSLIIWLQTARKLSSVIGGLLFLGSGWVTSWSVLCRVDMLALMLSLAGICFFIDERKRHQRTYLCLSNVCFMAALFTRQSAVAAPAACMVALMASRCRFRGHVEGEKASPNSRKRFQLGMKFFAGLFGGCLMLVGILTAITEGQFWRHVVTYTAGFFSWAIFLSWFNPFMWIHGIAVLLSAAYVTDRGLKRDLSVCALFWLFALLLTFTAGKIGASINYFLEFWASCCIVTGLIIARFEGSSVLSKGPMLRYGVVVCIVLQLFQLGRFIDRTTPSPENQALGDAISELVRNTRGDILSEYSGYLALNGRSIYFQPFSMSQLAARGLWDQSMLLEDIAKRRFELIIVSRYGAQWGRWTPEMAGMIQRHYRLIRSVSCFELHSYRHSTIDLMVFVPST